MHKALLLKYPDSGIPSEATVYRVMTAIGITHRPNRKSNGITKADREARKSDDLLKRDFKADKPFSKCVTDITEVKAKNGKLYVSAIFDCYDLTAVNGRQYESRTVRCNCRKYSVSVSRILRCGTSLRPREIVHKRFIQSCAERIWGKAEHEQRRRQMSRQRPLRKHVGANEERAVLQPWQKKYGLHDKAAENNDPALLHELLE